MNNSEKAKNIVRLFGMSGLQISTEMEGIGKTLGLNLVARRSAESESDADLFLQFEADLRGQAAAMSSYYELFYCLENSVRRIVRERMVKKFPSESWWEKGVKEETRKEVKKRMQRDMDSSFTMRSDDHLDFANFGELQEIIEANWDAFDDLFTSRNAVRRVLTSLNYLRGPIAHCCPLAEDEILRLKLTVRDWFRQSG